MEKEPAPETPENIDSVIEKLLERKYELFQEYIDLGGELSKELDERDWGVTHEAKVGLNREQAKRRLEEFIAFLEAEIAKKSKKEE